MKTNQGASAAALVQGGTRYGHEISESDNEELSCLVPGSGSPVTLLCSAFFTAIIFFTINSWHISR